MAAATNAWDYLIVTASNDAQAQAYDQQLTLRRNLGMLSGIGRVMVVADPGGKRIGSGGSTLYCLLQILQAESDGLAPDTPPQPEFIRQTLQGLRVLIVHAGGDSRRLPAYGPCGKIFVPVPGESDQAVGMTLFDRQLPTYLALPRPQPFAGQVVITSGDVLLEFDAGSVDFSAPGVVGLGCPATPQQASKHGVYCAGPDGRVREFLQKPSVDQQQQHGAVDRYGQSVLDIGVIHFDAATACRLLECFDVAAEGARYTWRGELGSAIESMGLDFYREVCCAMGSQATSSQHVASARASGSPWSDALLGRLFQALEPVEFRAEVLSRCEFLHFGTTRQLITSGLAVLQHDRGVRQLDRAISVNNDLAGEDLLRGGRSWVEGCRVSAPIDLAGGNVLVGLDVEEPLSLPEQLCVDIVPGWDRSGQDVTFVRVYGLADSFKGTLDGQSSFCNQPVGDWLAAMDADPTDAWPGDTERELWNARLFPAETNPGAYRKWLWMLDPSQATDPQRSAWKQADRYSLAEIAAQADQDAFHTRRKQLRAEEIRTTQRRMFRRDSDFSARELGFALANTPDPSEWVAQLLAEAQWHYGAGGRASLDALSFSRIMHSLATAVLTLAGSDETPLSGILPELAGRIEPAVSAWLQTLGIPAGDDATTGRWASAARKAAFDFLGSVIVSSGQARRTPPSSALRSDEIVWTRAPARLDLGGGWTDTPPYALEHGGCVINAAVNLNDQPPIHCYARVIDEPVIRITSIDRGTRVELETVEQLLDYRRAEGDFQLAKAALVISGFSPDLPAWDEGVTLKGMLEQFGGGIELTTLAAIPKGSGLGTSSIVGAAILATIRRLTGETLTQRELFHGVLKLEQELTTGGGWQDQVGGAIDGVKVVRALPSLVPEINVHYVPSDVLSPASAGGTALLYYTGITRLAKNILQQVVGRYLDRDRAAMDTLRQIHALPGRVADAMARKDHQAFGSLIDTAWQLNKRLDPNSTNEQVEQLLGRIGPRSIGAKLLGAGGGGFLLIIARSPADARAIVDDLESDPPNPRGRFFDFSISGEGLVTTVC